MFLMGNVALKFFLNKTIDFIVPSYSWCCGLFAQQLFINIKILKKFSVLAWGYFRVCMYIWLKKILYACYVIMHNFTLYITRCKNYSKFFFHLSYQCIFVSVISVMQHVRWLNNSMGFIVSYTRVAM